MLPFRHPSISSSTSGSPTASSTATSLSAHRTSAIDEAIQRGPFTQQNYKSTCCSTPDQKGALETITSAAVSLRPTSLENMLTDPPTVLGTIGIFPPELQEIIFHNLSWSGAIHFASTNRYYRTFIAVDRHGDRKHRMQFLRHQEDKPNFNKPKLGKSWYACVGCWQLKQEKRFNQDQVLPRPYRKGGGKWRLRRCLDCETVAGRYAASDVLQNAVGKTMRLCKACCGFRTGLFCAECFLCVSCSGGTGKTCPKCFRVLGAASQEEYIEGTYDLSYSIWK